MTIVDMRGYDSKPLVMEFAKYTITSPVPDGETLKTMKALMTYTATVAVVSESASKHGGDVQEAVSGVEIPEQLQRNADADVAVLALGEEELERLRALSCPEPLIDKAAMYALLYWHTGEDTTAGNTWLEQVGAARNPKAPRKVNQKKRARRKH